MRECLKRIGQEYKTAKQADFTGHALANYIRHDAPRALRSALENESLDLHFKCSAGQSGWADVPWLGIFDPRISPAKAQHGHYIVYLFNIADGLVYLSLNQGVTSLKEKFKKIYKQVLRERASLMRFRLPEFAQTFNIHAIDLGSKASLAKDYELGHAMGKRYEIDALPSEGVLVTDLRDLVHAYSALSLRGGLDSAPDISTYDTEDLELVPGMQENQVEWIPGVKKVVPSRKSANSDGQGYGLTPLERVAVEQHAMLVAKSYLETNGYQVEDVSRTRPYDYTASKNGEVHIVEVKGTTGLPTSIFLTIGEVKANKQKYPHNMLILVHSISLNRTTNPPKAEGGVKIVRSPWEIDEAFLRAATFKYEPTDGFEY